MSCTGSLQEAIEEFKCYNDRTTSLFERTSTCFQEIVKCIDIGSEENDSETVIPFNQLDDVERELHKSPSVFFIGERNCGKSSIINELLRQGSLPVDENPCTARIVRIKYAEKSYASLVGSNGKEVKRESFAGKHLPKELIVVSDEDREDENKLNAIVEVGLNHKLLRSGIELIDSPGKSESETLDKVLDDFLQKGAVPLFVYVIDGNYLLRNADLDTLTFLKDRVPQSPIMFVCNKVDITKEAQEYNKDEDDDDDDDDDDGGGGDDDRDDDEEDDNGDEKNGSERKITDKGENVFNQLKERELLLANSWETCPLFHAISAKEVREERLGKRELEATRRFKRFQSNLQHLLGTVMKTQTRRVVQKLLVLQESFVNVVQVQRTLITQQASVLPQIIKKGSEIEMKMFESLSSLTFCSEESKMKIVQNILGLKEEFVHEAEAYKPVNQRHLQRDAQTMVKTDLSPDLEAELAPLLKNNFDFVLERFLGDMKGSILEKTCSSLGACVESVMKDLVNDLTKAIIEFNEDLAHPIVSRILEESYDIQFLAVKVETDELLQIVLNGLLDSMKEAVCIALRREISVPLSSKQLSNYTQKDVHKKESRKSIVLSLLTTIDEESVAESVHEACFNRLHKMHELFGAAMSALASLETEFANCQMASRLEQFRVRFTPQIRTLAIEGMALQNMQNRGPVELGSQIANTRYGVIYDCISERWCRASPSGHCAVKVLKKRSLGEAIWNQTAVDLVNMMDMIQKLHGSHPNLLRLFGWVFPEPDVLHVVMEKAERGLLRALQEELPLIIRMNIAVDVAEGLKAIHDINYTYEDLKPGNILLMSDGTAKINLAKPEFPYNMTPLGAPFHISPEMYRFHGRGNLSYPSYDIYAFGMLLWVLCEGSGTARPQEYQGLETNEAMQEAVENEILPRKPPRTTDACWELMSKCWNERGTITMGVIVSDMKMIRASCWRDLH